ncbi:MAG: hypothetical protein HUK23_05605 [Sphaerochaetaceae bacterium]|nr:hypothetical protein [Sphaerochaetaceae bacterium]
MRTLVSKGQYFTTWVTSKNFEEPFIAPMVELELPEYRTGVTALRDLYKKYQVSQIKRQFLDRAKFFESKYQPDVSYDNIVLDSNASMIDFSGFWYYPTELTVYSKLYIESEEDAVLPLSVVCNGSIIAYVNGKEAFRILSEAINFDTVKDVSINVKKGSNEFVIALNELCERNTMIRFGICNKGDKTIVTTIPSAIKEEELEGLRDFFDSLDMVQEEAKLVFSCKALALSLQLIIADEDHKTQTIDLEKGVSNFSCDDSFGTHIIIANATYGGALFRKGFYRFEKQKVVKKIASTEKERKEHYIDELIGLNKSSPAMFIAGLTRGLNLYEVCKRSIKDSVDRIIKRADCSDFRLTEIIWMYCLGQDILSKELLDQFKACMLGYRYWFTEKGNDVMWFFSENHALSLHACEYIAGRLFPDEVFSNSNMTGRQHMEHGLKMIRDWFSVILEVGYTEWCSVNYLPVDMLGYMTLMKFSENEEINSLCKRAMDMTFNFYAMQCHKGVLLGANGRAYINDVLSPTDIQANAFCYFAWGTCYAPFAYKPTLYALTDYECPKELKDKALLGDGQVLEEHFVQGHDKINITIYKTKDYFMGSSGSTLEGQMAGDQEHLFDAMVGDEDGRFWINHPGEARVLGTRRPGYFSGNAYTPHVSQYKASAVISYRFPDTAEVKFTHLICFKDSFDKQILGEKDLFLRRGKVNVYIHADNGLVVPEVKSLSRYELRSPGLNNTWYVRIDDTMDFEDFVQKMRSCTLKQQDDKLVIQDPVYGKVEYALAKLVLEK